MTITLTGPITRPTNLGALQRAQAAAIRTVQARRPLLPAQGQTLTTDPAHWWPQYDEPIYAGLYIERFEQLAAGLLAEGLAGASR